MNHSIQIKLKCLKNSLDTIQIINEYAHENINQTNMKAETKETLLMPLLVRGNFSSNENNNKYTPFKFNHAGENYTRSASRT